MILRNNISWTGAASVASALKASHTSKIWHLRYKPVCASTEDDLSKWLQENPFSKNQPRAFFASRQNFGKGQYGRVWESPEGGLWLSAAIPFDSQVKNLGLFGLAVAVSVANTLQTSFVPVKLKWPNDLIVYQRKLAGFLPRIVSRGEKVKYARVGIGLNVRNRVPINAISLAQILGQRNISLSKWTSKVLISLEETSFLLKDPLSLCKKAEEILFTRKFHEIATRKDWEIKGINIDGSLSLKRNFESKSLYHWR